MMEKSLELLGVCEARLPGYLSKVIHDNYILVHKGKDQERHRGLTLIMSPELADRVKKRDLSVRE